MQIVGNSKIYFTILIYLPLSHHDAWQHTHVPNRPHGTREFKFASKTAFDPEMPLSRQLVQIIGRNKFSIRFESLCWILRVSSRTRMSQNQAKSNRDSFVKGTRLSELILAKSQAGRKFEVLEAACLVSIYTFID